MKRFLLGFFSYSQFQLNMSLFLLQKTTLDVKITRCLHSMSWLVQYDWLGLKLANLINKESPIDMLMT